MTYNLKEVQAKLAEVTKHHNNLRAIIDKAVKDHVKTVSDSVAKKLEVLKLTLNVEYQEQTHQEQLERLHLFEDKGVDEYWERFYTKKLEEDVDEHKSKRTAEKESNLRRWTERCQRSLEEFIQQAQRDKDLIEELQVEKRKIEQVILDLAEDRDVKERRVQELTSMVKQKELDMNLKRQEVQSAIAILTEKKQEQPVFLDRNKESEQSIKRKEANIERLQREASDKATKHEAELKSFDAKIAKLQAELEHMQKEAFDLNIDLEPEINRYSGLVQMAETTVLTSPPKKKRRVVESGR